MIILIVAAHPDDEVLGCGGTMAHHALNGDDVHVCILAEGVTSRADKRNCTKYATELSELASAAQEASKILGVKSLTIEKFPDNRLDSINRLDLIKRVERIIKKVQPEIVYTHHCGDLNVDHRRVHEAVVTACRPAQGNQVETLLFFEIPSSTECQPPCSAQVFAPNWFVDISETLDKKLNALNKYKMEMRDFPHPRSLKAIKYLAGWRGSNIGVEAAEAFVLGRRLDKIKR